jgi:8-oxo-dGTP pyrophosphatase MutT (NUDIX family)
VVDAAARELREETGVVVDPAGLGDPIAVCEGDWTFQRTARPRPALSHTDGPRRLQGDDRTRFEEEPP